ncbi:MAG: DEAD/DEAH box helicase [Spirochaetales bacterium]|jgi:ATP-dependent RNA helicase RhlB|nr:DEAD/DEAH box helicase [Spirochaetales bacterium]
MKFSELNLDARLLRAVEEAGFVECFPVQEETFRRTLSGQDVTVQSQTGSGKTAAFLVTIFQQLCVGEKYRGRKALVIVPTRELATQIEVDARALGKYLPYKIGSFFGGIGYGAQEALLREGVDVIIGTPGRLIDFSHQKKMNLLDVGILVIDEADRLFDMGFLPDLRKLLRRMPAAQERLTMLLSATLGLRVSSLAWEYMNGAQEIEIHPEQVTVQTITQEIYHVSSAEKMRLFLGILKKVNPKNAIIFTNTKHAAEEVCKRMEINGYKSQFIIGDLPQKKRLRIIDDMKEGAISFLVATDVAARGLHVEDLDLVVNYDVPEDAENYVHRIGRTARVGKSGLAVTLACEKYVFGLEAIEKYIDQKIPVQSFAEDELVEDKSAGMSIRTGRYGYGRDERGGDRHGRDGDRRDRMGGRGRDGRRRRESFSGGKSAGGFSAEGPAREAAENGSAQGHGSPHSPPSPHSPHSSPSPHLPQGNGSPQSPHSSPSPQSPHSPHSPQGESRQNWKSGGRGSRRPSDKKMNREERLAFYRDKYGEEFGADAAAASPGRGGNRASFRSEGKKSGRRDRPRRGDFRDAQTGGGHGQAERNGRGGQNETARDAGKKGQSQSKSQPPLQSQPKSPSHSQLPPQSPSQAQSLSHSQSSAKPGLVGRIIGFFKKKK